MVTIFYGNPKKRKVDTKHRIKVPIDFMEVIKGRHFIFFQYDPIVYTRYINGSVMRCFPEYIYKGMTRNMLRKPADDHERQEFFLAEKSIIDAQNRLTLKGPLSMLEHVILAANGDVFDIYDPVNFPYKAHTLDEDQNGT